MSGELPPLRQQMLNAVRLRAARRRHAGGISSLAVGLGRVGVLGWQIVVPALIGVAAGRWLDHRLASGIFWTAPLLFLGVGLGSWSAWKWIGRQ